MWYVIQVASGKEEAMYKKITNVLRRFPDTELFIPRYVRLFKNKGTWQPEQAVLFPGYIFLDAEEENAKEIQKALYILNGLAQPVCIGGGFYPIRQTEQDFLENVMDGMHRIEFSVGNMVDGKLVVDRGPLVDRTEYVCRIDRHRRLAELKMMLWGEEHRVRVGLEVKKKIQTSSDKKIS